MEEHTELARRSTSTKLTDSSLPGEYTDAAAGSGRSAPNETGMMAESGLMEGFSVVTHAYHVTNAKAGSADFTELRCTKPNDAKYDGVLTRKDGPLGIFFTVSLWKKGHGEPQLPTKSVYPRNTLSETYTGEVKRVRVPLQQLALRQMKMFIVKTEASNPTQVLIFFCPEARREWALKHGLEELSPRDNNYFRLQEGKWHSKNYKPFMVNIFVERTQPLPLSVWDTVEKMPNNESTHASGGNMIEKPEEEAETEAEEEEEGDDDE